ncbi:MAG: hypothetical protein IPO51_07505 [Dehalococcoidia bacterium]|nr:hypothetical protein [Dehalococcoidia bacterium]
MWIMVAGPAGTRGGGAKEGAPRDGGEVFGAAPGESSGADEEVAVLRAAGKPVWYSISEIPAG